MTLGTDDTVAQPAPLLDRIGASLSPIVFLCAVAIGFATPVALGRISTQHNMFERFVRFHQLIGAESHFNVTALQIYRLLEDVPPAKILVIVGGSSRLAGAGQRPHEVWSRHLQERLGPDYAVVNLALRAGTMEQGGALAAESMIKAGRRVLFVADGSVSRFSPLGGQARYWYLYYDWAARGLLLDAPLRARRLDEFENEPDGLATRELRLRSWLNRALYFDDLWTYVGYRHVFFAAWDGLLRPNPFAARVTLHDTEEILPENCCYGLRDFESGMQQARAFASTHLRDMFRDNVLQWGRIAPTPFRDVSLIVWIATSPFYANHLDDEARAGHDANMIAAAQAVRDAGFRAMEIGRDWSSDDYIDLGHLSEQGGRRLADAVAPRLEQMARDLGYTR